MLPKLVETAFIFSTSRVEIVEIFSIRGLFFTALKKKTKLVTTLSYKERSLIVEHIYKFEVLRMTTLNLELWLKLVKEWECRDGAAFLWCTWRSFRVGKKETQGFFVPKPDLYPSRYSVMGARKAANRSSQREFWKAL